MASTSASRSASIGSPIHSTSRCTLAGLALPTTVVTHGLVMTENCSAIFARLDPRSRQSAAACAHRSSTCAGAGCQDGAPRSVSAPMASGEALISAAPAAANSAARATSRRSCTV